MPLYGYVKGDQYHHLVSAADHGRACCGGPIDAIPNVQPEAPNVHPSCRVSTTLPAGDLSDLADPPAEYAAKAKPKRQAPTKGSCPVCGGSVRAKVGKVLPHRQWRMGPGGQYLSKHMCPGAGEAFEVVA